MNPPRPTQFEEIAGHLRRNRSGTFKVLCQVLALERMVEEIAKRAGLPDFDGVPFRQVFEEFTEAIQERLLLDLNRTSPGPAAQIQEDLDKMKAEKPPPEGF